MERLQTFAQGVLHRGPGFEQEAEQFDADVLTTFGAELSIALGGAQMHELLAHHLREN